VAASNGLQAPAPHPDLNFPVNQVRVSIRLCQTNRLSQTAVSISRTAQSRATTAARGPAAEFENLFETCERRLVLSAQLMFDVLGDQALELHGDIVLGTNPEPIPTESHLREAHAASGWNVVQQQFGLTGKGQTVAVIDSGIAWDHVALGRGFGPGYRVVGGWDFTEENDANPYDDGPVGFHGTHVAGIIGSDSPHHPGVAPDVDLVALRVFNDMGQGQLSWVEKALQWVHTNRLTFEHPITTVNLSLGTSWNANTIPGWATLEEELRALAADGIVVTASAGNSFQQYLTPGLSYPAASSYVLPVASVDDDGRLSDFSQRNSQIIAAPGKNILSSVPDHVLGRDGKIDDFTLASGTSMSAPYVAGASVLVRQAMEMVDYAGINLNSITTHLRNTADQVYDSITGNTYDRLNLARAIDALIPADQVGDSLSAAQTLDLSHTQLDGWINSLGDQDVYRFTAPASGTMRLDADSAWLDSLNWSLQTSTGSPIMSGGLAPGEVPLVAGQTYNLIVSADGEIGSFQFDIGFNAHAQPGDGTHGGGTNLPSSSNPQNLGTIQYHAQTLNAGQLLRVQASQDGLFTVQWTNHDAQLGSLSLTPSGTAAITDATWANGQLRIDTQVSAGQWLDIQLPGQASDQGELALANVVSKSGASLNVRGGMQSDRMELNLHSGLMLRFGQVEYAYPQGTIANLTIDAMGGNDSLTVIGSPQSDKVDLRSTVTTIENNQISVQVLSMEEVSYSSGGGPDRVYLYDTDGDDTLTARPRSAELVGVGYKFSVADVDRIFVHAAGGGQDFAYLYDSAGNDRLSVRPQFSSMSGDGFFNFVRGFERVYAYATAGGLDQAELYDSAGNDRFSTSGASASIVGPGFSSFTRSFEIVNAYSEAGGADIATLYGSGSQTEWQRGSDFIRFREAGLAREARGFGNVETFIAGQAHAFAAETMGGYELQTTVHVAAPPSSAEVELAAPAVVSGLPQASHAKSDVAGQPFSTIASLDNEPRLVETPHSADSAWSIEWPAELSADVQVLRDVRQLGDWLSERLDLSDSDLLLDPDRELDLLDKIFSLGGMSSISK
jgi:subtilisin family serine protease